MRCFRLVLSCTSSWFSLLFKIPSFWSAQSNNNPKHACSLWLCYQGDFTSRLSLWLYIESMCSYLHFKFYSIRTGFFAVRHSIFVYPIFHSDNTRSQKYYHIHLYFFFLIFHYHFRVVIIMKALNAFLEIIFDWEKIESKNAQGYVYPCTSVFICYGS